MSADFQSKTTFSKELVIPSKPEFIREVETFIDEISSELEFKDDIYGNVMVAVTEAVNNSIIHGNKLDESKKVFLRCESKSPYRLSIWVEDEGSGFDYSSLSDPTSSENIEKPGGRGVFIMRHLSDEIIFEESGKRIRMVFNI